MMTKGLRGPITLVVNKEPVVIDRDEELTIPYGMDQRVRSTAAARLSFYSTVWAAARRERMAAETQYKQWRDAMKVGLAGQTNPATGKPYAQAVIEQVVRAHADYVKAKALVADAEFQENVAYGMFESFKALCRMLSYTVGTSGLEGAFSLESAGGAVGEGSQATALAGTKGSRAETLNQDTAPGGA